MALSIVLGMAVVLCVASVCMAIREACQRRHNKVELEESTAPYEQLEEGGVLHSATPVAVIMSSTNSDEPIPASVSSSGALPIQTKLSNLQSNEEVAIEHQADSADQMPTRTIPVGGNIDLVQCVSSIAQPLASTSAPASSMSPKPRPSTPTKGNSSARTGSPARSGRSTGSPSKFSFSEAPTSRKNDTGPGPGSYELDSCSLSVRARATHNKQIAGGKGTFMTSGNQNRAAPRMTEETPDPSHYSDYYLKQASIGNLKTSNKHVRDGKIAFDSNGPRCGDSSFEERSPLRGPGHYDYSHLYESGVSKADKRKGTTAFTNKAPLLGYMRKIDTPGGGEYDPKRMDHYNSYSTKGTSAFASTSARCAEAAAASAGTAGPETYDLEGRSLGRQAAKMVNPQAPPFGTGGARIT